MTIPKHLRAVAADLPRLTSELRHRIDRYLSTKADAEAKDAAMAEESEAYGLSPEEHRQKTIKELIAKWGPARELAVGAGLFQLEPMIARLEADLRAYVAEAQKDVLSTLPDAFTGYRQPDMLAAVVAREALRPRIDALGVDELLAEYRRALRSRDPEAAANRQAEAALTMQLIEERLGRREGITRTVQALPSFRALSALVAETQHLRVPVDADDIEDVLKDARAAVVSATRAGVQPINLALDPVRRQIVERELAEV